MSRVRSWNLASSLLLALLFGVMLVTFLDYGITLDEGVQNRYGRRLVRAYATLGRDTSATTQNDLYFYGGLFELAAQAAEAWSGLGVYESRHLVNVLVGFLGFVAVWGLASHVGGPAAGFLGVLVLALTPSFYGHAFANPKDIPFASFYAWGAWCALRASEKMSWRRVLATGVAIGLASAVRVAGISLVAFTGVLWLGAFWSRRIDGRPAFDRQGRQELARAALALLAVLVVAWTLMVVCWPWALLDPVGRPLQAWGKFAHFWNTDVLWKGRVVPSEQLPRSYLVQMLALKLPEFYLVAYLLGTSSLVVAWRRRGLHQAAGDKPYQALWLGLLAVGPIAWAVLLRTPLYHGCRHVLFIFPFLAVLAALGVIGFLRSGVPRAARVAATLVIGALALVTAVDMIRLHPYQYVYFNRLVAGGLARAAERYETDYYIASYREGIDWAVRHYSQRARSERVRIAGLLTGFAVTYYLNQSEERRRCCEAVLMGQDPHLVLASGSYREQDRISAGKLVHVVERQGAPLLYVFELRPPR